MSTLEDFEILERLGKGSFGEVHQVCLGQLPGPRGGQLVHRASVCVCVAGPTQGRRVSVRDEDD
jgi:hypothetical protein